MKLNKLASYQLCSTYTPAKTTARSWHVQTFFITQGQAELRKIRKVTQESKEEVAQRVKRSA